MRCTGAIPARLIFTSFSLRPVAITSTNLTAINRTNAGCPRSRWDSNSPMEKPMNESILLTEDEFDQWHPLLVNHLNPNASWGSGDGDGCLFETYGEEVAFVGRRDPRT